MSLQTPYPPHIPSWMAKVVCAYYLYESNGTVSTQVGDARTESVEEPQNAETTGACREHPWLAKDKATRRLTLTMMLIELVHNIVHSTVRHHLSPTRLVRPFPPPLKPAETRTVASAHKI